MIYRFNIWFEDKEEITRSIEIGSNATFEEFHKAILSSINFDSSQMASFYVCDENWNKGIEVTQFDMTDLGDLDAEEINIEDVKPIMSETKLSDFIRDPKQKFIYVYDFIEMWTLKIQLMGIEEEVVGILYPRTTKKQGEAPAQHKGTESFKLIDDLEMDEIAEQIKKEYTGGTSPTDPYGDDDAIDPDIMDEFNDLY